VHEAAELQAIIESAKSDWKHLGDRLVNYCNASPSVPIFGTTGDKSNRKANDVSSERRADSGEGDLQQSSEVSENTCNHAAGMAQASDGTGKPVESSGCHNHLVVSNESEVIRLIHQLLSAQLITRIEAIVLFQHLSAASHEWAIYIPCDQFEASLLTELHLGLSQARRDPRTRSVIEVAQKLYKVCLAAFGRIANRTKSSVQIELDMTRSICDLELSLATCSDWLQKGMFKLFPQFEARSSSNSTTLVSELWEPILEAHVVPADGASESENPSQVDFMIESALTTSKDVNDAASEPASAATGTAAQLTSWFIGALFGETAPLICVDGTVLARRAQNQLCEWLLEHTRQESSLARIFFPHFASELAPDAEDELNSVLNYLLSSLHKHGEPRLDELLAQVSTNWDRIEETDDELYRQSCLDAPLSLPPHMIHRIFHSAFQTSHMNSRPPSSIPENDASYQLELTQFYSRPLILLTQLMEHRNNISLILHDARALRIVRLLGLALLNAAEYHFQARIIPEVLLNSTQLVIERGTSYLLHPIDALSNDPPSASQTSGMSTMLNVFEAFLHCSAFGRCLSFALHLHQRISSPQLVPDPRLDFETLTHVLRHSQLLLAGEGAALPQNESNIVIVPSSDIYDDTRFLALHYLHAMNAEDLSDQAIPRFGIACARMIAALSTTHGYCELFLQSMRMWTDAERFVGVGSTTTGNPDAVIASAFLCKIRSLYVETLRSIIHQDSNQGEMCLLTCLASTGFECACAGPIIAQFSRTAPSSSLPPGDVDVLLQHFENYLLHQRPLVRTLIGNSIIMLIQALLSSGGLSIALLATMLLSAKQCGLTKHAIVHGSFLALVLNASSDADISSLVSIVLRECLVHFIQSENQCQGEPLRISLFNYQYPKESTSQSYEFANGVWYAKEGLTGNVLWSKSDENQDMQNVERTHLNVVVPSSPASTVASTDITYDHSSVQANGSSSNPQIQISASPKSASPGRHGGAGSLSKGLHQISTVLGAVEVIDKDVGDVGKQGIREGFPRGISSALLTAASENHYPKLSPKIMYSSPSAKWKLDLLSHLNDEPDSATPSMIDTGCPTPQSAPERQGQSAMSLSHASHDAFVHSTEKGPWGHESLANYYSGYFRAAPTPSLYELSDAVPLENPLVRHASKLVCLESLLALLRTELNYHDALLVSHIFGQIGSILQQRCITQLANDISSFSVSQLSSLEPFKDPDIAAIAQFVETLHSFHGAKAAPRELQEWGRALSQALTFSLTDVMSTYIVGCALATDDLVRTLGGIGVMLCLSPKPLVAHFRSPLLATSNMALGAAITWWTELTNMLAPFTIIASMIRSELPALNRMSSESLEGLKASGLPYCSIQASSGVVFLAPAIPRLNVAALEQLLVRAQLLRDCVTKEPETCTGHEISSALEQVRNWVIQQCALKPGSMVTIDEVLWLISHSTSQSQHTVADYTWLVLALCCKVQPSTMGSFFGHASTFELARSTGETLDNALSGMKRALYQGGAFATGATQTLLTALSYAMGSWRMLLGRKGGDPDFWEELTHALTTSEKMDALQRHSARLGAEILNWIWHGADDLLNFERSILEWYALVYILLKSFKDIPPQFLEVIEAFISLHAPDSEYASDQNRSFDEILAQFLSESMDAFELANEHMRSRRSYCMVGLALCIRRVLDPTSVALDQESARKIINQANNNSPALAACVRAYFSHHNETELEEGLRIISQLEAPISWSRPNATVDLGSDDVATHAGSLIRTGLQLVLVSALRSGDVSLEQFVRAYCLLEERSFESNLAWDAAWRMWRSLVEAFLDYAQRAFISDALGEPIHEPALTHLIHLLLSACEDIQPMSLLSSKSSLIQWAFNVLDSHLMAESPRNEGVLRGALRRLSTLVPESASLRPYALTNTGRQFVRATLMFSCLKGGSTAEDGITVQILRAFQDLYEDLDFGADIDNIEKWASWIRFWLSMEDMLLSVATSDLFVKFCDLLPEASTTSFFVYEGVSDRVQLPCHPVPAPEGTDIHLVHGSDGNMLERVLWRALDIPNCFKIEISKFREHLMCCQACTDSIPLLLYQIPEYVEAQYQTLRHVNHPLSADIQLHVPSKVVERPLREFLENACITILTGSRKPSDDFDNDVWKWSQLVQMSELADLENVIKPNSNERSASNRVLSLCTFVYQQLSCCIVIGETAVCEYDAMNLSLPPDPPKGNLDFMNSIRAFMQEPHPTESSEVLSKSILRPWLETAWDTLVRAIGCGLPQADQDWLRYTRSWMDFSRRFEPQLYHSLSRYVQARMSERAMPTRCCETAVSQLSVLAAVVLLHASVNDNKLIRSLQNKLLERIAYFIGEVLYSSQEWCNHGCLIDRTLTQEFKGLAESWRSFEYVGENGVPSPSGTDVRDTELAPSIPLAAASAVKLLGELAAPLWSTAGLNRQSLDSNVSEVSIEEADNAPDIDDCVSRERFTCRLVMLALEEQQPELCPKESWNWKVVAPSAQQAAICPNCKVHITSKRERRLQTASDMISMCATYDAVLQALRSSNRDTPLGLSRARSALAHEWRHLIARVNAQSIQDVVEENEFLLQLPRDGGDILDSILDELVPDFSLATFYSIILVPTGCEADSDFQSPDSFERRAILEAMDYVRSSLLSSIVGPKLRVLMGSEGSLKLADVVFLRMLALLALSRICTCDSLPLKCLSELKDPSQVRTSLLMLHLNLACIIDDASGAEYMRAMLDIRRNPDSHVSSRVTSPTILRLVPLVTELCAQFAGEERKPERIHVKTRTLFELAQMRQEAYRRPIHCRAVHIVEQHMEAHVDLLSCALPSYLTHHCEPPSGKLKEIVLEVVEAIVLLNFPDVQQDLKRYITSSAGRRLKSKYTFGISPTELTPDRDEPIGLQTETAMKDRPSTATKVTEGAGDTPKRATLEGTLQIAPKDDSPSTLDPVSRDTDSLRAFFTTLSAYLLKYAASTMLVETHNRMPMPQTPEDALLLPTLVSRHFDTPIAGDWTPLHDTSAYERSIRLFGTILSGPASQVSEIRPPAEDHTTLKKQNQILLVTLDALRRLCHAAAINDYRKLQSEEICEALSLSEIAPSLFGAALMDFLVVLLCTSMFDQEDFFVSKLATVTQAICGALNVIAPTLTWADLEVIKQQIHVKNPIFDSLGCIESPSLQVALGSLLLQMQFMLLSKNSHYETIAAKLMHQIVAFSIRTLEEVDPICVGGSERWIKAKRYLNSPSTMDIALPMTLATVRGIAIANVEMASMTKQGFNNRVRAEQIFPREINFLVAVLHATNSVRLEHQHELYPKLPLVTEKVIRSYLTQRMLNIPQCLLPRYTICLIKRITNLWETDAILALLESPPSLDVLRWIFQHMVESTISHDNGPVALYERLHKLDVALQQLHEACGR